MQPISVRITEAIKGSGKSQKQIALEVGVTPQAVNRWTRSGIISKENLYQLALKTGTSMEWLLGIDKEPKYGNPFDDVTVDGDCRVQILSTIVPDHVAAYAEMDYDASYLCEGSVHYATKLVGPRTFVTEVCGDAMVNNERGGMTFLPGWRLIVDPDAAARPGSYVLAGRKEKREAVFRQLVKEGGLFYLKPLNTQYPLKVLEPDMFICGTVVDVQVTGLF